MVSSADTIQAYRRRRRGSRQSVRGNYAESVSSSSSSRGPAAGYECVWRTCQSIGFIENCSRRSKLCFQWFLSRVTVTVTEYALGQRREASNTLESVISAGSQYHESVLNSFRSAIDYALVFTCKYLCIVLSALLFFLLSFCHLSPFNNFIDYKYS